MPASWAASAYPNPDQYTAYLERNEIPWLPKSPEEFEQFFNDRHKALALRIARLLDSEALQGTDEGGPFAAVPETIDDELAVAGDT